MNTSTAPDSLSAGEILRRARDLISDPARFCQTHAAQNAAGAEVPIQAQNATCWCAYGAIYKIGSHQPAAQNATVLLRNACLELFGTSYVTTVVRGDNGHARILEAFALAAERALTSPDTP